MTKLAPNFTYAEFVRTGHRAYLDENWTEGHKHINAMQATATLLQAIRDRFRSPVIVTSGFRCAALNTAVGGSSSQFSQHVKGEAADFYVVGVPHLRVFDWVRRSDLPYGQLILEGITADRPTWIHLSLGEPWRAVGKSRQAMSWDKTNGYVRIT